MDRIGHRRLQFIGFGVMAAAFLVLAAFAHLTTMVVPFLAIFGLSYFFVAVRAEHDDVRPAVRGVPGQHADHGPRHRRRIGKLGAFVGVFLVPQLQKHFGLRGMLTIAGVAAISGFALTSVLPEPARRTLEEMHDGVRLTEDLPSHGHSPPRWPETSTTPRPTSR